jgi:hypothetical protein
VTLRVTQLGDEAVGQPQQLPEVAGEGVRAQVVEDALPLGGRKRGRGLFQLGAFQGLAVEGVPQPGKLLGNLPEGGHAQHQGDDAVEEVRIQLFLQHLLGEVGGGDEAEVARARRLRLPAERGVLALLERADEQALDVPGDVSDLVQEQGVPVGDGEQTVLVARGPGEGARLVAEELRLDGVTAELAASDRGPAVIERLAAEGAVGCAARRRGSSCRCPARRG